MEELLEIKDLRTYYFTEDGVVKAVDGVDLVIRRGETLGLVGESGCGKSTLCLSIMRLIEPPGEIVGGQILLDGEDLLKMDDESMRKIRGNKISMIFQDPSTSLNPVFTVGYQLMEAVTAHLDVGKEEAKKRVVEVLERVGIPDAEKRLEGWPHEFSAGMKQRIMIAMALLCEPDLLIADEPTSNLDVTIQAQILELMKRLKYEYKSSILLVTHNLGIVAELSDSVAVMYAGKIVEYADAITIFRNPLHPYTRALLRSIPRLDLEVERLEVIPGEVPSLINPPPGCRFHPRCKYAREECKRVEPQLEEVERGHYVACLRVGEVD